MRQALRIVPALLLALFVVAGCKDKKPTTQLGTPGGTRLDAPARLIASLSPSSTEVLALHGGSNWLVGRTESCNYPAFVKRIPVVMAGIKPDYEKMAQAVQQSTNGKFRQPDLIVYDPALFNDAEVALMKKNSRMEPFALGGDSIDAYLQNLRELSKLYTGESFISTYVDEVIGARNSSLADPVTPKPRVAILMPGEGAEHMIAGTESYYADEIRAASGEPVGPKGNNFLTLNVESLIQMNPDVIITAGNPDSVIDDKRLQSLSAVKNGRVRGVAQDALLRRGARLPEVIGQVHSAMAELMRKKVSN